MLTSIFCRIKRRSSFGLLLGRATHAHSSSTDVQALHSKMHLDDNVSYCVTAARDQMLGMELECSDDGHCTVVAIRDTAQTVIRDNVRVGDLLIEWNDQPLTPTTFDRLFEPHTTLNGYYQLKKRRPQSRFRRAAKKNKEVRLLFLHRGGGQAAAASSPLCAETS